MSEKEIITLDGTRVETLWTTVEAGEREDGTEYEKKQAVAPRTFTSAVANSDGTSLETILADIWQRVSWTYLSDLPQVNVLTNDDKFLVGTAGENKAIAAEDVLFAILDSFAPAEMRRMIFRGKNLGTVFTSEQKACIQDGTFKGLFLGDYWEIGGYYWRIADFDYWYQAGDTPFTNHHLVIMPDTGLYTAQMNETNITTGAYVGSKMYTEKLADAKTLAASAFGTAVLTHREYLTNAVTDGYPSAGAWYDSNVELPNEIMIYGSLIFTPAGDGSFAPNRYTISKTQLALFSVAPKFANIQEPYWLRDAVSSAAFAYVNYGGLPTFNSALASYWVRPVFPIG